LPAGRESALQWRRVSSQQGSHSLESVNRVVDALHNRVEVHCLNVSGGSVGICKNCQFFSKISIILVLWKSADLKLTLQSPWPKDSLKLVATWRTEERPRLGKPAPQTKGIAGGRRPRLPAQCSGRELSPMCCNWLSSSVCYWRLSSSVQRSRVGRHARPVAWIGPSRNSSCMFAGLVPARQTGRSTLAAAGGAGLIIPFAPASIYMSPPSRTRCASCQPV
jgi:hypothetical protein